jgi:poly(A) polymerase
VTIERTTNAPLRVAANRGSIKQLNASSDPLASAPLAPIRPVQSPQQFAVDVVRQLRAAGYQALFAGGCVRDHLLGTTPKDYDVATDATPDQVIAAFPNRKTLAIGAAFGVIAVVGPRSAGMVEVATFRRDLAYSDGRHPDGVEFCSPEEDAQRRDFTINGMFFDPLEERVHDYVGGQADLQRGVIRAIGDARQRFTEDKLRLLRAVRFTARLGFTLEEETKAAIQELAPQLGTVSVERIAEELRKMLVVPRRAGGCRLLRETKLLGVIFPEWQEVLDRDLSLETARFEEYWNTALAELEGLAQPSFPLALAMLLAPLPELLPAAEKEQGPKANRIARDPSTRFVQQVGRSLKLSNDEIDATAWLVRQQDVLTDAATKPWSEVQPLLIMPWAKELLQWSDVRARILRAPTASLAWCRERLAWPPEQLDPPPILTGNDLIQGGIKPGPLFTGLLAQLRAKQLDGHFTSKEAAWEWLRSL